MSQVQWLGGVEWLGEPPQLTQKYKVILVAWSKAYYGPVFTPKYGDWSGDSSNTWDCFRDGQTLSAFSKWRNNKTGANLDLGTTPDSGECKNVLNVTLTPAHQKALDAFAGTESPQKTSKGPPDPQQKTSKGPPDPQQKTSKGPSSYENAPGPKEGANLEQEKQPPATCPAGQSLVDGKCVTTALAPATTKKTPWGLILGGVVVVGGLAWLAMRGAGAGVAASRDNPSTRTKEERRAFLHNMAKADRRDGTDWAERLLEEWSRRQIVSQQERSDLRRMLRGSP